MSDGRAADLVVDARGRRCPLPIIDLARRITEVPVGGVVSVLADDPAARHDVPAWCEMRGHEYLGDIIKEKLVYYPTVTRDAFDNEGRITDLIATGKLFTDLDVPPFSPENDRVMLCGSTAMLKDTTDLLKQAGLVEGKNSAPGHYVIERAFVD